MAGNPNIASFLKSSKLKVQELLDSNELDKTLMLHIVIGNESGDLDSVVSSIVYAYHLHTKAMLNQETICLPIINIPKEDFILKTEVIAVFQKLDFEVSDSLVFRDELLSLAKLHTNLEVVLMDHNVLPNYLYFLHPRVTEVIDHHQDSKTFQDPYVSKTIESVGSCCTLVAESMYNQSEHLFREYPITELLLSAILLDTVNLSSQSGRMTEKDVEFAEELQVFSRIPGNELFDVVQNAKFNMATLSCLDILRKDFKTVPCSSGIPIRAGVSSITLSLETFLKRDTWLQDTASFTINNNLVVILLMFIHKEAEIAKREILVYSTNNELRRQISESLLGMSDLKLTRFESHSSTPCTEMFRQGHVVTSRKLLMPKLSEILSKIDISIKQEPRGKIETSLVNGAVDSSAIQNQQSLSSQNEDSRIPYFDAGCERNHNSETEESPSIVNTTRNNNNTINLHGESSFHQTAAFNGQIEASYEYEVSSSPVPFSEPRDIKDKVNSASAGFTRGDANISQNDAMTSRDDLLVSRGEASLSWKDSLLPRDDAVFSKGEELYPRDDAAFSRGEELSPRDDAVFSRGDALYPRKDAFVADRSYEINDKSLDQPTLEFEYDWNSALYDMKSSKKRSTSLEKKHKIMIRDLSFDESNTLPELVGMDLLCPVFLAVTEDDEDDDVVLKDIRRKTKSIENLCSIIPSEEEEFPLRRTKSELPMIRRTSSKHKKAGKLDSDKRLNFTTRHDSIQEEETYDENPFAGDREFSDNENEESCDRDFSGDENEEYHARKFSGDENEDNEENYSEAELSTSRDSADFGSEMKSTSSFSHPLQRPSSTGKAIERFSFSDESLEMYETHEDDCECSQCRSVDISIDFSIPKHVPGLWDRFVTVNVGNLLRVVDLRLIEPYMKVISHGGFYEVGNERRVIMVFTAAFLPQKYIPKYKIIMEQLFYYVVHTLDLSVGDNYDVVYFNNSGPNMPGRDWLKKCYNMITRRLKKNLQSLFLVHPDFWLKAMVRFYRPFISSKFFKKIHFIKSLKSLRRHVSMEYIFLPDEVKKADPESVFWLRS